MAWKEYWGEYRLKDLQESMDRCTGRHDISEILLKMVLNPMQVAMNSSTGYCPEMMTNCEVK